MNGFFQPEVTLYFGNGGNAILSFVKVWRQKMTTSYYGKKGEAIIPAIRLTD